MKNAGCQRADDLRSKYDFASMEGGVRGKYARTLQDGSNIVVLEPDLADAFPTSAAVNEALRAVLKAKAVVKGRAPVQGRSAPVARRRSK